MSTKKSQKSKEFWAHQNEAKKYGVATVRPQDIDKGLAKEVRRVNLKISPAPAPPGYRDQLEKWIQNIPDISIPLLKDFSMSMVIQQMKPEDTQAVLNFIQPPKKEPFGILSVDFEFHKENSYDGFICVSSVSSVEKTTVVSCLYENRKNAENWIGRMLTSKRILKVMCGCDNDIIRIQKEWSCFPVGVIDVQDAFVVWKTRTFTRCLDICYKPIKKRLEENKRNPCTIEEVEEYLQKLEKPGLAFLADALLGAVEDRKKKCVTYADWRLNPLPLDMVKYSAEDSYLTLQIFYILTNEITTEGVKEAAKMTVGKMFPKEDTLATYKSKVPASVISNPTVTGILKWRMHVALNLDFPPGKVLTDERVASLSAKIDKTTVTDVVKSLLQQHQVPGNLYCLAKSLQKFIEDPFVEKPKRFKDCLCHNCNEAGHCAFICPYDENPSKKKEFFDRPSSLAFKLRQDKRRRKKWCEKRNLDFETFTDYPWLMKNEYTE